MAHERSGSSIGGGDFCFAVRRALNILAIGGLEIQEKLAQENGCSGLDGSNDDLYRVNGRGLVVF